MIVIPAVDILGGKCVRLVRGEFGTEKLYDDDPASRAREWEAQGAKRIHVVDLDGARHGRPVNLDAVEAVVGAVECEVELGGGVRRREDAVRYVNMGVARVILGTAAVEEKERFEELAGEFPGRLSLAVDVMEGKVATRGWRKVSEMEASAFLRSFDELPLGEVVCTSVARDGTLSGPDLETLELIVNSTRHRLIASGGVSSADDVRAAARIGAWGCIIGTALYEGAMTLEEALAAAEE